MTKIAIFDYGAGNLFSLKSALERNGAKSVDIIYDLKELTKFDGLVLPGVGNFDPAIRSIERSASYLNKAIGNCMPLLGICLGMEILFNKSEEGRLEGLKILDGEVVMLPKGKVKVPHMGWNNLKIKGGSKLLKGIKDHSWVYFVHSYKTVPRDRRLVMATSDYGVSIPAM
nr:imidazole glycerol phosphate synthase subunit HisH [Thermoproteota archaeon]